ncbi:MAG: pilus assembly protein CpaD [Paracoccaceae bacterium]|jgi:pilus assembly protein CpaD
MSPKRRIFISQSRLLNAPVLVVAVLLMTVVTGCAPEMSHWSPEQNVKRNDVRWITFQHHVRFGGAAPALDDAERNRLRRFLTRHDAGYGDRILIGSRGIRSTGSDIRRASRRETAVAAELRKLELPVGLLPEVPAKENWDGTIKIVLGRYIVIPPNCPDWTKRADGDSANRRSSNFGCASAVNLGLMVANPGDLLRGRTAGPADGAAGARRYKSYREGAAKKSPAITPLIIQSSVGGGQ